MKLLPIPLSPLGAPPPNFPSMWGSDLLWRYPPASPFSPLAELKTQLPQQLSTDPRAWGRDEVTIFLRWCEREFDLPKFEVDLFQMNGKALCFLTKTDLAERCPGAGDILHNVLQMLIRDTQMLSRHLPSSPVTPTNRYPLSPHSHPPTPNWNALAPPDSPFYASHLQHFMSSNSITLSPAPSTDSQAGSPPQLAEANRAVFGLTGTSSGGSNQSDSEEDTHYNENKNLQTTHQSSPPLTPITKDLPHQMSLDSKQWHQASPSADARESGASSSSSSAPSTPGAFIPVKREFFPDTPEPNTNGRLLWDFLQQLLNDPQQRYSNYIAWKCRDTGVFKIVDPAGLAKLWGIQKNHLTMNYDKMSRALRYYYRVNILRKVQGERHCYQFLRNPTELKSIKNISLLRQSMSNSQQTGPAPNPSNSLLTHQQKQSQLSAMISSISNSLQHSSLPTATTTSGQTVLDLQKPPFHRQSAAAQHLQMQRQTPSSSPDDSLPPPSVSIKMETTDMVDDNKPTDLSLSVAGDRKFGSNPSSQFYPLIRNANGLTTIQLLRPSNAEIAHASSSEEMSPINFHFNQQSALSGDDNSTATDLRKSENSHN